MDGHASETDKGIGISMAFGVLALLSAGVMFAGETQLLRAWGFAAAITTAGIAVLAVQLYGA